MVDAVLLSIAKSEILSQFDPKYKIDKEQLLQDYPFLAQKGATFVTLKKSNDLRGCIGSIVAHRTLLDDLLANASSAAFSDPRFSPLESDELNEQELFLEVSLLSEPQKILYTTYEELKQKVVPFEDGLILHYQHYHATFLPQVWEQLPSIDHFLEHLSYKAGADRSIYEKHPDIYRYRVEHREDRWDAIPPL